MSISSFSVTFFWPTESWDGRRNLWAWTSLYSSTFQFSFLLHFHIRSWSFRVSRKRVIIDAPLRHRRGRCVELESTRGAGRRRRRRRLQRWWRGGADERYAATKSAVATDDDNDYDAIMKVYLIPKPKTIFSLRSKRCMRIPPRRQEQICLVTKTVQRTSTIVPRRRGFSP